VVAVEVGDLGVSVLGSRAQRSHRRLDLLVESCDLLGGQEALDHYTAVFLDDLEDLGNGGVRGKRAERSRDCFGSGAGHVGASRWVFSDVSLRDVDNAWWVTDHLT